MHWYFEKEIENDFEITYRYSTDNKVLDGLIRYEKNSKCIIMDSPCARDKGFLKGQEMAKEAFCYVVKEDFPQSRHVCCG